MDGYLLAVIGVALNCLFLLDGKLYQEKVQSIMYLRHSSSGGKSTSSSVVSLSPTVFTDAPHEGTQQTETSHSSSLNTAFWVQCTSNCEYINN